MQSIYDFILMRNILQSFANDPLIPRDGIKVEIHNGCVFLSGTVARGLQRWTAEGVVRRVATGAAVDNQIVITVAGA